MIVGNGFSEGLFAMPLSRSPRTDRRRRTIRENLNVYSEGSDEGRVSPSRTTRNAELPELTKKERGAAYSHSVRGACHQRVVQFIPIRKISLAGAVAASAGVPLLLVVLHYLVFVSGTLNWSGHPMSALLNANSPRSLAAWMSSHMWLLCLGATVLTFRYANTSWMTTTATIVCVLAGVYLFDWQYRFDHALNRIIWSCARSLEPTACGLEWTSYRRCHAGDLDWYVGLAVVYRIESRASQPGAVARWIDVFGLAAQRLVKLCFVWICRWPRGAGCKLPCGWLACRVYGCAACSICGRPSWMRKSDSSREPWRVLHRCPGNNALREAMPKLPRFGRSRADEESLEEEQATTKRKRKVRPAADSNADEEQETTRQSERQAERRDAARPIAANRDAKREANDREKEDRQLDDSANDTGKKRGWGFGLGKLALRPQKTSSTTDDEQEADEREYGKKPGWFSRRKPVDQNEAQEPRNNKPTGHSVMTMTRLMNQQSSARCGIALPGSGAN